MAPLVLASTGAKTQQCRSHSQCYTQALTLTSVTMRRPSNTRVLLLSWEDMAAARGGGFEPLGQQGAHSSCNQPPTQVPCPADTRPIKSTILSCCKMYCCQGHRGLRFQHLAAHLLMADRDADGSQYDQGRKWANFGRIQAEKGGWRRKFADRGGQGAEQGQIRVSCGFGHVSGEACRLLAFSTGGRWLIDVGETA